MKSAFRILLLALVTCWADTLPAEVKLPGMISDHMLFQRDMPLRIWGWADPQEPVTVEFGGQQARTAADADGNWEVTLPAMKAGGPYELVVTGKNRLAVTDVLIGDLWICAGQSNMNWVMVHKTTNFDAEIAAANYPQIRLFTAPQPQGKEKRTDLQADWHVCSSKTVGYFSAVAYYFGRELHTELDVPIGLMVAAVDGTRIEPWTPGAGVQAIAELQGKDQPEDGELFNAMIHPLTQLPIKGVIWYQGEGNVGDGMLYYHRMRALVGGWRKVWKQGEFPFYYVQIAPLNWGGKPVTQQPELWEAQTAALQIPNVGMVVTNDIGNVGDPHPRNKRDVGKRLARWALGRTYGRKDLVVSGPLYKSMEVEGPLVRVHFEYADGGLRSRDGKPLSWFTVAGEDGIFHPATAEIDGPAVVVTSPQVPHPVAVRFGWHQTAEPNLMNAAGLPASSFRSDR